MRRAPPMPSDDHSLVEACRARGLRATPQRVSILRALRRSGEHPGPEALHREAQRELSSLSLATVYKTLETLEAHGVIEEVTLRADSKRYDANLAPHHHLVCVICKRIEDLVDDALAPPLPRKVAGFRVTAARVQIMGVCAACGDKKTSKTRGRPSGGTARKENQQWRN